jgi:hypothetical protein
MVHLEFMVGLAFSVAPSAPSAGGEMHRVMFQFWFRIRRPLTLDSPSARDQLDEQHHKSNHEKDVNKSPQGIRRNYAY